MELPVHRRNKLEELHVPIMKTRGTGSSKTIYFPDVTGMVMELWEVSLVFGSPKPKGELVE